MGSVTLSPPLDETHRLLSRGRVLLLVRRDWEVALPVEAMLGGAPLAAWGRPVEHKLSGRGRVHVLATAHGELVAKQLQRGGIVGGLLRNLYFDPQRPLREAEAAELLARRGVRTPAVVAARMTRRGAGWRLELATARERGVDLLEACRTRVPLAALARAAGRTLAAAHAAGLRHRDLQVKNLFVPAGFPGPGGEQDPCGLVLLDLDRCSVGPSLDPQERLASLIRLGRSLVKHGVLPKARSAPRTASGAALWACRACVRAYGDGEAGQFAALVRGVRREVRVHRWLWGRP